MKINNYDTRRNMKSYTDLNQSKRLAEILPAESADLYFDKDYHIKMPTNGHFGNKEFFTQFPETVPCWSLATLIDLLPNNEHIETTISRGGWEIEPAEYLPNTWWCEYEDTKNQTEFNISADNPVDACVEMIIKLYEKNLL